MAMRIEAPGPRCARCQGSAVRAMRSRSAMLEGERVAYVAYVWSCTVCGNEWSDEALELLNTGAAARAKTLVRRARTGT
jgi:hypothetical protein